MDRYPSFSGFTDHDSSDCDAKISQVFGEVGYGVPFDVASVPIARDTAVVELGVDASLAKDLTLGVAYSGQYGGGSHDNAILGAACVEILKRPFPDDSLTCVKNLKVV
ncbi:MAG TPA: autotransporter outer membrane beta-barrel domain-containing protein [Paraburkholderia sp.]|jgi:uncharacterized protein with beta-barrel porin domain